MISQLCPIKEKEMKNKNNSAAQLLLRISLSVTLLSAVADRLGFWGKYANWGNWQNFEDYTIQITSFLPEFLSMFGAYAATFLETAFALLLLAGYKTKLTAMATSILLFLFALCMSITLGIKAPLDYSVWVGSAAAFLLSTQNQFRFSFDNKFINQ